MDPEVDTVICCLEDTVLVAIVRGIVADVSADTVVDPEVYTVIHCMLFRGYCDSSGGQCCGCIGGYSGGSRDGYNSCGRHCGGCIGGYSVGHIVDFVSGIFTV